MTGQSRRRKPYLTETVVRGERKIVLVTPSTASATGKMRRQYFQTEREGQRALKDLEAAILTRGKAAAGASVLLVNDALKARANLDKAGFDLSLAHITSEWLAIRAKQAESVTVRQAVADWLEAPGRERRERTHKDLKRMGGRLVEAFGDELFCDLNPPEVIAFLDKFSKTAGSFNSQLQRLLGLFRHAERRGWCQAHLVRAIQQPKTMAAHGHDVATITPDQFKELLAKAQQVDPALVDYIAVLGLAGVRPAEAERLRFEHFQPKEKQFVVPKGLSKTHSRRVVPIMPALQAWLSRPVGFYDRGRQNGPEECLFPRPGTLQNKIKVVKRLAGFHVTARGVPIPTPDLPPWPADGLRHTFASAYVTLHPDQIASLVFSFGHAGSLNTLRRHYVGAYSPKQAQAWFSVVPGKASKLKTE